MMSPLTVAQADRMNAIKRSFKKNFATAKVVKPTAPVEIPVVRGMEVSVRYVAHANDIGFKPALCFRGIKWAHCIVNEDEGIRVMKIDVQTLDKAQAVEFRGAAYPIKRCAEQLMAFTNRLTARKDITEAARELVQRVLADEVIEEKAELVPVKAKVATSTDAAPTARSTILAAICAELNIEPAMARRVLRKAGLHAPYNDAAVLRRTLKK
jgi:hypothetical protein